MPRSSAGFLSSDRSFLLPRGRHVGTAGDRPRGYPIDLSVKAQEPRWKEAWRGDPGAHDAHRRGLPPRVRVGDYFSISRAADTYAELTSWTNLAWAAAMLVSLKSARMARGCNAKALDIPVEICDNAACPS